MKKSHFLANSDVQDFISWAAESLPSMQFKMDIAPSRFVPNGLKICINGFNEVIQHYCWKYDANGSGGWDETKQTLNALSTELRAAIEKQDQTTTLNACKKILRWGGNRRYDVGAWPFLNSQENICSYLEKTRLTLSLDSADTDMLTPPVELMNSMLTKIHALNSNDGLPIYDSRVAAAIATLVECWRVNTNKNNSSLPAELDFPATLQNRTVLRRYPKAKHLPAVMTYGTQEQTKAWTNSKIRLGWLMSAIVEKNTLFNGSEEIQSKLHQFESSLFMLGYNPSCIDSNKDNSPTKGKVQKMKNNINTENKKTIRPLSEEGEDIVYAGDSTCGFSVQWGETIFEITSEFLDEIISELEGKEIPLGASQDRPIENGFGMWLKNRGWTPRHASAIAPILHNEGFIEKHSGKKPIRLLFKAMKD